MIVSYINYYMAVKCLRKRGAEFGEKKDIVRERVERRERGKEREKGKGSK